MLGARSYKALLSTMLWLLLSPTVNARGMFFYIALVSTRLWLLLSPTDSARSMVLSSIGKYHALSVVIA